MTLTDDIDISRGNMIVGQNNSAEATQDIDLMICWMNKKELQLNGKYSLKHTSNDVRCIVKSIQYKININTA